MASSAQGCGLIAFMVGMSLVQSPRSVAGNPPRLWRAIDLVGMDLSRKPVEDFYQFANGKWLTETEIPAHQASVNIFSLLKDHNQEILHQILEDAARDQTEPGGSVRALVAAFYRGGMDVVTIDAAGASPLQEELRHIEAMKGVGDLPGELARLHLLRVDAGFTFSATEDVRNSARIIARFQQGGLGLPLPEHYLKQDEKTKAVRTAYVAHLQKMGELLGDPPALAAQRALTVLALETRLARASRGPVELRDPRLNYHLVSTADFEKETPGVLWKPYFEALGLGQLSELTVGQPAFLQELGQMLIDVPLNDWKTYLRWQLVHEYAEALSSPFVAENFHFFGTVLNGIPRNRPRWQRLVQQTDIKLGEALGQLYVAKAFPPEAKQRAEELVQNIKQTMRARLASLEWMTPQSRRQALAKLDAMRVKIGYPRKWRDYSALTLDHPVHAQNLMAIHRFQRRYQFQKIGKPVNRDEWFASPTTVDAYYDRTQNEMIFPAGILQPPFLDTKADDAVNYGALGTIIGHELTHGFDDQGRKFDADGNLRDWWLPQDEQRYNQRAARIAQQYGTYLPLDNMAINGNLTLGENLADLGGVKIAYLAFTKTLQGKPVVKIDGYTPEQRFFLSFAQTWRSLIRPEALRLFLQSDQHSPGRFRVLGPLYNMPEFFQVFEADSTAIQGRLNPKPVEIW